MFSLSLYSFSVFNVGRENRRMDVGRRVQLDERKRGEREGAPS